MHTLTTRVRRDAHVGQRSGGGYWLTCSECLQLYKAAFTNSAAHVGNVRDMSESVDHQYMII